MKSNLDDHTPAYADKFKYAQDNETMLNWYPHRILKKMNRGSLLELGLGHGFTAKIFASKVPQYVVIEGSPQMIVNFRQKFHMGNIEIVNQYFENFTTDKKFDNIVMGFILEHVDDPGLIIDRYKKYLKENGKLFITVPNAESLHRRIGFEAGILDNLDKLTESDHLMGHKRYFNLKTLSKFVISHGLKILSAEGIFLKPITTEQIKTLNFGKNIIDGLLNVGIDYPELSAAILLEVELER